MSKFVNNPRTKSQPKRRGHKNHYTNILPYMIKVLCQKYMTSAKVGYAPPSVSESGSKGWWNPYLQSEGTRIRTLSPLRKFGQSCHIVPTVLLVRVQCPRKDLYKAVEGPSTRPIVISMITESYFLLRKGLTISEPDETKSATSLILANL